MSTLVSTGSITITDINDTGVLGWTPVLEGAVSQDGSTFTKVGGGASVWDSQVYSRECYTAECYCSATTSDVTKYAMFGLNTDPTLNASFNSIDYAWYMDGGSCRIYESGTNIGSSGVITTSTVLAITYDGINVIYYKDGVAVRTAARAIGNPLYFDSSFSDVGSRIVGVNFGQVSGSATTYAITSSAPVITKLAPDAATAGAYSVVTVTGTITTGGTTTQYGYLTVTANGDTEAATATANTITTAIVSTAGKSTYTVKMYNSATVSGATLLDSQTIPVVFQGATGPTGLSVAHLLIYYRSTTAPGTPTGGSYDFGTLTLTTPTSWSVGPPSTGSGPTYASRATASIQGVTGVDSTLTWTAPVIAFQDGAVGDSIRKGYSKTTLTSLATTPTTITTTGNTSYPANASWGAGTVWGGSPLTLAAGETQYTIDGVYSSVTGNTVWNFPYMSWLKVGSLEAITANTGSLTNTGTFTSGSSPARSGTTMTGSGLVAVNDGTFSIGNAAGNITYNGSQTTIYGPLIYTGNIKDNAITNAGDASHGYVYGTAGTSYGIVGSPLITISGTSRILITYSGVQQSHYGLPITYFDLYENYYIGGVLQSTTPLLDVSSGSYQDWPNFSLVRTKTAGTYVWWVKWTVSNNDSEMLSGTLIITLFKK